MRYSLENLQAPSLPLRDCEGEKSRIKKRKEVPLSTFALLLRLESSNPPQTYLKRSTKEFELPECARSYARRYYLSDLRMFASRFLSRVPRLGRSVFTLPDTISTLPEDMQQVCLRIFPKIFIWQLRNSISKFAQDELAPHAQEIDAKNNFANLRVGTT